MSVFNDPTRLLMPLVKITAHDAVGGTKSAEIGDILVPYEMSSLKSSYSNCIKSNKTAGGDGTITKFNYSEPSEMGITLLLDDTTYSNIVAYGMPNNLKPDSIDKIIGKLLKICHSIDGKSHQPYFVRITPLQMPMVSGPSGGFGGFLSSMNIKNDIVDMLGNRVKAKVELAFTESKSAEASDKQIGYSSPDLTHILQTYSGDTLANKVNEIYGNPRFVHAVAEMNSFNTVRRIKVGGSVKFPPLDR